MDKYHESVKRVLTEKGELGVNSIARELNMSVSTLQKYLENQSYFKKTEKRRWDLPHKVAARTINEQSTTNFELVASTITSQSVTLRSQLEAALMCLSIMDSQVMIINDTAKLALAAVPPVADKPRQIHQALLTIEENAKVMTNVIKSKLSDIPEEYQQLLLNTDWLVFIANRGVLYVNNEVAPEISNLVLKEDNELSDEVTKLLNEYQKPNKGQSTERETSNEV